MCYPAPLDAGCWKLEARLRDFRGKERHTSAVPTVTNPQLHRIHTYIHDRQRAASFAEMALRIMPRRIMDERLAEEHLDLVIRPVLRWERLQKHDNALQTGEERSGRRRRLY